MMAIASLEAFVNHFNTYAGGNDWNIEEESGEQHIIIPMFNLRSKKKVLNLNFNALKDSVLSGFKAQRTERNSPHLSRRPEISS